MTDQTPELKPCPFCGHEAELSYCGEENQPDPYCESWTAICVHCGCDPASYFLDKQKAVEVWNTRAAPKVKPLVWLVGSGRANYEDHEAWTMLGTYSCRRLSTGSWTLWKNERRLSDDEYATIEEVKAAAQARHDRNILSELA